MERLTFFEKGRWWANVDGVRTEGDPVDRLAAYEDTGLTPGEIKSMQEEHFSGLEMAKLHSALMELKKYQEADKDGRIVVLPCKVGDTVWISGSVRGLYRAKVRTFFCGHTSGVRGSDGDSGIKMIRTTECDIPFRDFGKTVFLTREEAEEKLKEVQKDNGKSKLD